MIVTFIIGLLYYVGYPDDILTEILFLDGQEQFEFPKLYEYDELLGCFDTVYCILYPEDDTWCTEPTNTDNRSLKISK